MSARGIYDNAHNRNKTRVDGRTGNWATSLGVTSQHKDMRGNVIGGIGPRGERLGTKATNTGRPAPSGSWQQRLQSPDVRTAQFIYSPIPGVDMRDYKKPSTNQPAAPAPPSGNGMVQTPLGNFQPVAPTPAAPKSRQQFYADQKASRMGSYSAQNAPAAKPTSATPGSSSVAQSPPAPRPAAAPPREGKINGMPASQAIAQAKVGADKATTDPRPGQTRANANIASKGTMGAIADYFQRSKAEKSGAIAKATLTKPTGNPKSVQRGQAPMERKSWAQTAGLPDRPQTVPSTKPAAPQNFSVPAPKAVQSVGQSPTTNPAATAGAGRGTAIAKPKVTDKNPVTFTPAPRTDYKNQARELIAKDMASEAGRKQRRETANANIKVPSWQEGTGLGWLNKRFQRAKNAYIR